MKYIMSFLICLLISLYANNYAYSEKLPQITIVTPGAIPIDNVARQFISYIKESDIIVLPIPGASGDLAASKVVTSNNVYILFSYDSPFYINRVVNPNANFKAEDFTVISPILTAPFMLVTTKKTNIQSFKQFVDFIQTKDDVIMGVPGNHSVFYNKVLTKSFKKKNIISVYYKTQPELQMALIRGDVDYAFIPASPFFRETPGINIIGLTGTKQIIKDVALLKDIMPDMIITSNISFAIPKQHEKYVKDIQNYWKYFLKDDNNAKFVEQQGFIIGQDITSTEAGTLLKKYGNKIVEYLQDDKSNK